LEDIEAGRECRGWLLLLKSKPVLDSTAAIREGEGEGRKKKEKKRVRARASSSCENPCLRAGAGPAKIGKECVSSRGGGGGGRRRFNTRMGEKGTGGLQAYHILSSLSYIST
jgi:hypothetical protein